MTKIASLQPPVVISSILPGGCTPPSKLGDEIRSAMLDRIDKGDLREALPSLPLGTRMHQEVLLDATIGYGHADGMKYTAFVPVGPLGPNPNVETIDPKEAKAYFICVEGGVTGATLFYGPFDMPSAKTEDTDKADAPVAAKGSLKTQRTFSGTVEHRFAPTVVGAKPGGTWLVLDKPLKIGKAIVSEVYIGGAPGVGNGEKHKVSGSLEAKAWGYGQKSGVYYQLKAKPLAAAKFDESIDGKTVTVKAGQPFQLRFASNGTRVQQWHVRLVDRTFGQPTIEHVTKPQTGASQQVLTWQTNAMMVGEHVVRLDRGGVPVSRTITFTVKVEA